MKWRSASSAGQFWLLNQTLTLDQVAEFRRTRRVKEGTGSSASVSAAFGPVGPIHPGNPGSCGKRQPAGMGQTGVVIPSGCLPSLREKYQRAGLDALARRRIGRGIRVVERAVRREPR